MEPSAIATELLSLKSKKLHVGSIAPHTGTCKVCLAGTYFSDVDMFLVTYSPEEG